MFIKTIKLGDNKMSNEYLKRKDLLDIIDNNIEEWNNDSDEKVLTVLDKLLLEIDNHNYIEDKRFIINGRRDSLINEFNYLLETKHERSWKNVYEVLHVIWQFISNDYEGGLVGFEKPATELGISIREAYDMSISYRKDNIICLQEKEIIISMIKRLQDLILLNK